jgi:hypothetical protein
MIFVTNQGKEVEVKKPSPYHLQGRSRMLGSIDEQNMEHGRSIEKVRE